MGKGWGHSDLDPGDANWRERERGGLPLFNDLGHLPYGAGGGGGGGGALTRDYCLVTSGYLPVFGEGGWGGGGGQ